MCGLGELQAAAPPQGPRCPWPPQPGPWGCFLLRVLALQPHSQHVFLEPLLCATRSPCRRHCGRKAQTCPPTRPLPTLFPESSEKKRELRFHASASFSCGLCPPVSACVSIGVQTHTSTPMQTGALSGAHLVYLAGTWQSSLAGACSPASSVPPLHTSHSEK